MPDEKRISLNFFKLEPTVEHGTEQYDEHARQISNAFRETNLPEEFTALPKIDKEVHAFQQEGFRDQNNILMGTLVNTQLYDIPPKYDIRQEQMDQIDLQEQEGIGHPTCFLFDREVNVLMIQSVQKGVSPNSFREFFKRNLNIPDFIPSMVINPADMEKFYQMDYIKKFHVKVARVEGGRIYDDGKDRSIGQITQAADDTGNDVMEYKVQKNSKHDTLSIAKIQNWVRDLLDLKTNEEVEKLEISGREEEEKSQTTLDLVDERLKETMKLDRERFMNFRQRDHFDKMQEVYDRHRDGLIATYRRRQQ